MAAHCRLTPDLFAGTRWAPWLDRFRCVDCGVNTRAIGEYYMVDNAVWAAAGLGPRDAAIRRSFTRVLNVSWRAMGDGRRRGPGCPLSA